MTKDNKENNGLSMLQEQDLKRVFQDLNHYNSAIQYEDFIDSAAKDRRFTVLKLILGMDISKANKSISISTFLRKETIGDRVSFSDISKYSDLVKQIHSSENIASKPELSELVPQALNGILATLIDNNNYSLEIKLEIIERIYNLIQKN